MIDEKYQLLNFIGKGGSSKVFLAKDLHGSKCVLKVLRKDKAYSSSVAADLLEREHQTLKLLQMHPNIINSFGVSLDGTANMGDESENVMYTVLEYAEHGPLSNFIRFTGAVQENVAQFFMLQMCHALEFIHSQGYAHLDIKLENILLDKFFNIKVADMGASVPILASKGLTKKRRGTVLYMAPEVLNKTSKDAFDACKADIFSLGITLFVMLVGEFPSGMDMGENSSTDDSSKTRGSSLSECKNSYACKQFKSLSLEAQELLEAMTAVDPACRPSVTQILESEWMTQSFSFQTSSEVYAEMEARKEFMLKTFFKQK